jgi:hypothetical protein
MNDMKRYILITGASSGIGQSMAALLAAKGYPLLLVARRLAVLQAIASDLQNRYGATIVCMQADLSEPGAARQLYQDVQAAGIPVEMLVNNAGTGLYGRFIETSLDQELSMMHLNMDALVVLTKLFGQQMAEQGSGRILNVASLLSFLPFPYYTVYSATKAFVLAFSETLAAELADSGVVVTALCPGPVDTSFNTADMLQTNGYAANKPMPAEAVARQGVALLLNGKGKKIVGFNNWFISNLPRIMPDTLMMRIKKHLASQR